MLWRVLQHVEQGFYIDVGANDPVTESVTKAFSERGWHGINIEPLLSHYVDLKCDRPRDVNLQCAAGESSGEVEIWECDVRGWATASEDVAAQHSSKGYSGEFHKVPVLRLSDICGKYVTGEIHFLKIDVEGFEKSVINGMDFTRFRPWVMVIEATRPNSTEENYTEWESDVCSAGYDLAYCDGLNRFYLAKEHAGLINLFLYPPNVFDKFVRYEQFSSELRAQQAENSAKLAESRVKQAEAKAQQAEEKAQQAEEKTQQAEVELEEIYSSRSWRITAPLRWFVQQVRLLLDHGHKAFFKIAFKKFANPVFQAVFSFVNTRPSLQNKLVMITKKIGIYDRMKIFYHRLQNGSDVMMKMNNSTSVSMEQLTPQARQIYADLNAAIKKNKEQK